MPVVSGKVCVGAIGNSYNCVSFDKGSSTGANKLKKDPGCNVQTTITYRGKTVSAQVFGNGAPYNSGGGIGQTGKTVTIEGVAFHLYVEDEYFINGMGNYVSCVGMVTWPNYPHAP
jgi:hypothetical protein